MPMVLVLGDRAEENFRNAIKGSQGDFMVFFSNGLVSTHHVARIADAVLADDFTCNHAPAKRLMRRVKYPP